MNQPFLQVLGPVAISGRGPTPVPYAYAYGPAYRAAPFQGLPYHWGAWPASQATL